MMRERIRTHPWHAGLLLGLTLCLMAVGVALAAGNIDPANQWAWGTNMGWINFSPAHGSGVTVYSDHLEGYAWAENIGWIRLGTCSGSPCSHANTTAANYGVNNDGVGNLSGFAWGTNVGWINFNPTHSQVTVDPVTGDFDGYAWGENVGWIHFKNTTGNAYKVNTTWRGDLTATYQSNVAAIITSRWPGPSSSAGLIVSDYDFLHDAGDGIIFGHNNAAYANVTDHLPSGVDKRWARIWQLDVHDGAGTSGGRVNLVFDISDAGGMGNFDDSGQYYLLKRATGSSDAFTIVTVDNWLVTGDKLTFRVDVGNLGSEFTLGAEEGSPTAVTLASLTAVPQSDYIRLEWQTVCEVRTQGFNVYRAESPGGMDQGMQTLLNRDLIPAAGDPIQGGAYDFEDRDVLAGVRYYYWLEAVASGGAGALHGPVSAGLLSYKIYLPLAGRSDQRAMARSAASGLDPSLLRWVQPGGNGMVPAQSGRNSCVCLCCRYPRSYPRSYAILGL